MSTASEFPCPACANQVPQGSPSCPQCGLRLVGADAARLWQVNQQIGALRLEADHLIGRLRQPVPTGTQAPSFGAADPAQLTPYPSSHPSGPAAPAKKLSGQQILLGLGALLLLSGVSFFLLVVWLVVGLVGQAVIMVGLTAASVVVVRVATTRRLPAAAETFAVIASGLVLIDLWAAHGLNLFGLGNLPANSYWAGAGLLGGALLLGFDAIVPRTLDGAPLRPIFVYRPAASVFFTAAVFNLLSSRDSSALAISALAAVLAALCVAGVWLAVRLDRPVPDTTTQGRLVRGRPGLGTFGQITAPWSALPPALVLGYAIFEHLVAGAVVGYNPDSTTSDRYLALALLLILPALALVVSLVPSRLSVRTRRMLRNAAVLLALPAAGIALVDSDRWVLVGVAVVVAGGLVAEVAFRGPRVSSAGMVGWVLLPLITLVTLVLVDEQAIDVLSLMDARTGSPAPWWLPVLPAFAWTAASLAATLLTRVISWAVVTQVAVATTLFMLLRDAETVVQVVTLLVVMALSVALAAVARSVPESASLPESASSDRDVLEGSALCFAAIYALVAIALSADGTPFLLASSFVLAGVCTLAYSASPGRLPVAYLGSLLVTAGTTVLWNDAGVETVEAFTAPLVVLLAAIGFVQWRRDPDAPTMLTMGPALGAALLPSTMVGIEEGESLRLILVTAASVVVLVLGLARHLRAPVTVAAFALILVAITQGGPLLDYVPGWILLIGAGAVLLAIGVAWERAVLAGRRTATWYSTLR